MKKILLSAAVTVIAALAMTAKNDKDPVVMTVDGRDVKLSEFEYLYNKNNNQQLTPLSFDEYVDMFVNYKLKVADALNARLDTTPSFSAEFEKFRRDLAEPYLQDSTVIEQLVQEAYSHAGEDVYVSHIMMAPMAERVVERLDSIRNLINNGEATFEDMARMISVDKASAVRGGHMGWVSAFGPYPWPFEKACYDTPIGQVSEVVNSGVGYHLILPEKRRPARGEVKVQHILLMTRGMDDDAAAAVKQRIDSIYSVATPDNFSQLARTLSQDPGSARNGGELDWFGSGRMVAEFDSVSFAMPDGAISEPFATAYGYHIVHKLAHRGVAPLDEMRESIEQAIQGDSRAQMPRRVVLDRIAAQTGSAVLPDYLQAIQAVVAEREGRTDSLALEQICALAAPAYRLAGEDVSLAEVVASLPSLPLRPDIGLGAVEQVMTRAVNTAFDRALVNYEIDRLQAEEPEYSNLVNEYRDGILLFDISNQKVWDRAAKDTEGLKAYFAANRDKYCTWTAPKFKAYVIFAPTDSLMSDITEYINATYGGQTVSQIDQEKFTSDLRGRFGNRNIRIERVIAAQGDNPYTDYLGFGGSRPVPKGQTSWDNYAAFGSEIISQPEEVTDVKGAVVTDYQGELEKAWLDDLHKKYKVKINKKELQKADHSK